MRDNLAGRPPNVEPIDNELEERDGDEREQDGRDRNPDGPPSQRTRARLAASELAAWDDPTMLPLIHYTGVGTLCCNVTAVTAEVPSSFYECLQTPECDEWRAAYDKHMAGKAANGTCTFVALPDGKTAVKSKLVPAIKYNSDNTVKERTIRWVGKGYSQVEGRDYDQTYTATSKAASVRVFVCMLLTLRLEHKKLDVPKAFTRAEVDREIYVEQPEPSRLPGLMCKKKDKHGKYFVARLHKALEGLKQAGHLFQRLNTEALLKMGFRQLESEPTIFVMHCAMGLIATLVWIDDYAMGVSSDKMFRWFVDEYRKVDGGKLDIKDEGPLTVFAGLHIEWGAEHVEIHQTPGIERGIQKHFPQAVGLKPTQVGAVYDKHSRSAPQLEKCGLREPDEDSGYVQNYPPYLSFIATGLYYTGFTRGDLLFLFVFLSRFASDPNEQCFIAGLMALSCLYYTRQQRIRYTRSGWHVPKPISRGGQQIYQAWLDNLGLHASPDASWKIKTQNGRNMTYRGHVIMMCGAAVDWACQLLRVISHSSAEAEIAAGCMAGKRMQFIRALINEMAEFGAGKGIKGALIYLIDNSACEPLTRNIGVSKPTEHFLRWQHYLRWLVYHKYAVVIWISTNDETGDLMTKVLPLDATLRHRGTFLNKK